MLKKVMIAVITLLVVGSAPQTASARGGGFRGGGFRGGGFRGGGFRGAGLGLGVGLGLAGAGAYYYGDGGCIRLRRIWTPYGYRLRRVNVCY